MSALAVTDLTVRARGRTLLDHVTLELEAGELVALLGPNGAGKTTLLRAALGLAKVTGGSVKLGERTLAELGPKARAAAVGWLPQEPLRPEPVPVLEAVLAARYRFAETREQARRAALGCLERAGTLALAERLLSELSGGERQRVALAALLSQEARVVLLDEPASHLDPAQQAETYALIGALADGGISVLCVTHDVNLLSHVGKNPRLLGLKGGKLHAETRFDAPDLADELERLFDVPMQAIVAAGRRFVVPVARPGGER